MPFNLVGAGGLFTRLGHLIYGMDNIVNQYRGTTLSNRVDLIQLDYSTSNQDLVSGIYNQLTNTQNANTQMLTYWRTLAQNTVTQMVNDFQPQLKQDYKTALGFLVGYLVSTGDTVKRNTVSSSVTPGGSNTGNGVVLVTHLNNLGLPQEQIFNESIIGRVTRDASNGATAGQETLQLSGTYGVTDNLHWLWPQGSNAVVSLTAITPSTSNNTTTKNWLTNGMMEKFTVANIPDGWHVHTGTPGTSILKDTGLHYDGVSSVKLVSNGTEQTSLWTQFGVDFNGKALSTDQLAVSLWYKLSAPPTAGVLSISLMDGSGTVLNNSAGAPSTVSIDLTGGSVSWVPISGFLRMPAVIPANVYLAITTSTPITPSGVTINLDHIAMAQPALFYPGGPSLACFSGSTNWVITDRYTVNTSNAFNGLIHSGCNKLLELTRNGLAFPSTTGTPTILDSLVI